MAELLHIDNLTAGYGEQHSAHFTSIRGYSDWPRRHRGGVRLLSCQAAKDQRLIAGIQGQGHKSCCG